MRWAAISFTLTAILSIIFAIAGDSYDARFAYATFGPLAAGAAIGAWGIGTVLARVMRQRRGKRASGETTPAVASGAGEPV
jgi:hypothetical protein